MGQYFTTIVAKIIHDEFPITTSLINTKDIDHFKLLYFFYSSNLNTSLAIHSKFRFSFSIKAPLNSPDADLIENSM